VTVENAATATADFSRVLDRLLVFDDFFSGAQILLLEQWALRTPHWALTNSSYDEQGKPRHRIWGASYIEAVRRHGWPGLPPVLFSAVATMFRTLGVMITSPEYVGLNGQSRGQDGSHHLPAEPRGCHGRLHPARSPRPRQRQIPDVRGCPWRVRMPPIRVRQVLNLDLVIGRSAELVHSLPGMAPHVAADR
jgi:hypothetical protein